MIPLVGEAGEVPVQALAGALRRATLAASAYKNVSFNVHDAQVLDAFDLRIKPFALD